MSKQTRVKESITELIKGMAKIATPCYFCNRQAKYDTPRKGTSGWAYMCEEHFQEHHIPGDVGFEFVDVEPVTLTRS